MAFSKINILSSRLHSVFYRFLLITYLLNEVSSAAENTSTSRIDPAEGHCIWYGQCNKDPLAQNCFYNGPAKPLSDTQGRNILKKWCPEISPDSTCCNTDMLMSMDQGLALPGSMLKRCPSCLKNFVKSICQMSCSPVQSKFLNVTMTKVNPKTNQTYVTEIDFYITNTYMEATYTSCKQVSVPSTGTLALDVMCGPWGASKCSALRWYEFMGTKSTFVPFQINYRNQTKPLVDGFTPLNPTTTSCSKSIDDSTPACSCVDCEESCPAPPPAPPKPEPFKVAGYDGYAFTMVIIFLAGSALFILAVVICSSKDKIGLNRGNYEKEMFEEAELEYSNEDRQGI